MPRAISALIICLVATTASAAVLEVPANGGNASGIGYFSGWKCPPNDNITLVTDGGAPIPVATGIRRGDTAAACGNEGFNGFISQFNFNLLGTGEHTVVANQNGVPFASATFRVTTFGANFLGGASGTFTLLNFPGADRTATIKWSEASQNFVIVGRTGPPFQPSGLTSSGVAATAASTPDLLVASSETAVLEVPRDGGDASGIGYFSGWKCPPNDNLSLVIDGGSPIPVATGIRRGDTAAACGNSGFNGFIAQFNFNLLGNGEHTVNVRRDGVQLATATFRVTTFGVPFVTGVSGVFDLKGFPGKSTTTTVEWSEGSQNFVIVGKSGSTPVPSPSPTLRPPGPTPRNTPTPIVTGRPSPSPRPLVRVRFGNQTLCRDAPYLASMSANGYGWQAFTDETSDYVEVARTTLAPITTVNGGCGRYNYGGFGLTAGRRYRIVQNVSPDGPVLSLYDEGALSNAETADAPPGNVGDDGSPVAVVHGEAADAVP